MAVQAIAVEGLRGLVLDGAPDDPRTGRPRGPACDSRKVGALEAARPFYPDPTNEARTNLRDPGHERRQRR